MQYLIVPRWGNGEPTQDLIREVPNPLVLPKISFTEKAGSECKGGTACGMLQNTEVLLEKEKTEAVRLLQVNCFLHTDVSLAPCFCAQK